MWIHLLPLRLIDGAGGGAPPQTIFGGAWTRKKKKKREEIEEDDEVTPVYQEVSEPAVDLRPIWDAAQRVRKATITVAEINQRKMKRRREEEFLILLM